MRPFALVLFVIITLGFCINSVAQPGKEARKALIQSLKELKQALTDKDSKKVSTFFSFPIPDSAMEGLSVSDIIDEPPTGKQITEGVFLKYFTRSREYEDLDSIFQRLRLENLAAKDDVEYNDKRMKRECYSTYMIKVEGDLVHIEYFTTNNEEYVKSSSSKGEQAVDASACEFLVAWHFRFDGKRLHFTKFVKEG